MITTSHGSGLVCVDVVAARLHLTPERMVVLTYPYLTLTQSRGSAAGCGVGRWQVSTRPGGNGVGYVGRIGRSRNQVVRIIETDEALGVQSRGKQQIVESRAKLSH